jgi:hypothetical protein
MGRANHCRAQALGSVLTAGRRRAAVGVRVVVIFGVQGWHWDWVREVRELVFALDADSAGQ